MCPIKIWHGSGDTVNQIDIGKQFINKLNEQGKVAEMRVCPTSNHGIWNNISGYVEGNFNISPYAKELYLWLENYN